MSAEKNRKSTRKVFRLELGRTAAVAWSIGLLLALLWMFLLGLFVGKGLSPANINLAEIKKRMVAEGIWPGSGKRAAEPEKPPAAIAGGENIPIKDLEFYEALAKKKQVRLTPPAREKVPEQKTVTTPQAPPSTANTVVPPPAPAPTATEAEKPSSGPETPTPGRYAVQVASFREEEAARKFALSLKELKPQVTVHSVDLPGKGRWYRVQSGSLLSRQEADALAARLQKEHQVKALVVRSGE
jgi:cell division septation protein DedD